LVNAGHNVALFHRGQTVAELRDSAIHIHGERQQLGDFVSEFESFSPQVVLDMFAYTEQDARLAVQTFRGLAQRLVCVSSMTSTALTVFSVVSKLEHQTRNHLMKKRSACARMA
jgi:hypothetical protein